jgi:hypothetical protein
MCRTTPLAAIVCVLLMATGLVARPTPLDAQAPERTGTASLILLVRHAEKAAEPASDPPLTVAGVARAQALAMALRDAGVTARRNCAGRARPLSR